MFQRNKDKKKSEEGWGVSLDYCKDGHLLRVHRT